MRSSSTAARTSRARAGAATSSSSIRARRVAGSRARRRPRSSTSTRSSWNGCASRGRNGSSDVMSSRILIIDFGSQYTQLIARRVREARVYSEIHPPTRTVQWVRDWKPTGIILSGGPCSVYGENVPTADPALLDIAPVLGICYGMQLIAHLEGGAVERVGQREYGRAEVDVLEPEGVLAGFHTDEPFGVWMSH